MHDLSTDMLLTGTGWVMFVSQDGCDKCVSVICGTQV